MSFRLTFQPDRYRNYRCADRRQSRKTLCAQSRGTKVPRVVWGPGKTLPVGLSAHGFRQPPYSLEQLDRAEFIVVLFQDVLVRDRVVGTDFVPVVAAEDSGQRSA